MDESERVERDSAVLAELSGLLERIRTGKEDAGEVELAPRVEEYVKDWQGRSEEELEEGSRFLLLMANLLERKTRAILPDPRQEEPEAEDLPVGEEADPEEELARRLAEYRQFQEIAHDLREYEQRQLNHFGRGPLPEAQAEPSPRDLGDIDLEDLILAFRRVWESRGPDTAEVAREPVTVAQRVRELWTQLMKARAQRLTFEECFLGQRTRGEVVISFLAILELCRRGLARVYQEDSFGQIEIQGVEDGEWPDDEPALADA